MTSELKTVNEKFNHFLIKLGNAEKQILKIVNDAKEDAGTLVMDAANKANQMETEYLKALEEKKSEVMKQVSEIINDLKEQFEKEVQGEILKLSTVMESRKGDAINIILNMLFG